MGDSGGGDWGVSDLVTKSRDPEMVAARLFVGKLETAGLGREEFVDRFSRYGRVLGVAIKRGFGFVQFGKAHEARAALQGEDGATFRGGRMEVRSALDRFERQGDQRGDQRGDHRGPGGPPPHFGGPGGPAPQRPPFPSSRFNPPPGMQQNQGNPNAFPNEQHRPFDNRSFGGGGGPGPFPGPMDQRDGRAGAEVWASEPKRLRQDAPNNGNGSHFPGPSGPMGQFDRAVQEAPKREAPADPWASEAKREPAPAERKAKPLDAGRPWDAAVVALSSDVLDYAEKIERRLVELNLSVDVLASVGGEEKMGEILEALSRRGFLYAFSVQSQHARHGSLTLNILHGSPEEHRNMPLGEALSLVGQDLERYVGRLRVGAEQPSLNFLLHLLAESRHLSLPEMDRVIAHLSQRRQQLAGLAPQDSATLPSASDPLPQHLTQQPQPSQLVPQQPQAAQPPAHQLRPQTQAPAPSVGYQSQMEELVQLQQAQAQAGLAPPGYQRVGEAELPEGAYRGVREEPRAEVRTEGRAEAPRAEGLGTAEKLASREELLNKTLSALLANPAALKSSLGAIQRHNAQPQAQPLAQPLSQGLPQGLPLPNQAQPPLQQHHGYPGQPGHPQQQQSQHFPHWQQHPNQY